MTAVGKLVRDVRDTVEIRGDLTFRRLAASYRFPDGSQRVYCHHVRKTAGTSLYLSFLALGGEDPIEVWRRIARSRLHRTVSGNLAFASNHRTVLAEGAYFFGRSHRAAGAQPLPPSTFTVTVLRDPAARAHSYFDYLVAGDDPSTPGRVGAQERRIAADGFDAFLDRVPRRDLLNQLATFSEQFDISEAVDRIAACSSVFFTEDYAQGLKDLAGRLDVRLQLHRSRVTGSRSELTEAQAVRLRDLLEPEYELLWRLEAAGVARKRSSGTK